MHLPNVDQFIQRHITGRTNSFFASDIEAHSQQLSQAVKGRSVLVIGGAGTIGSSYIKAILRFEPSELTVIDTDENGLTELTRDLRSGNVPVPEKYTTYPLNFDDAVFRKVLDAHGRYDIVANFAAHKHVRSEKDKFSVEAMIENNVFRAERLLDLLSQNPPDHFFCVSTDKAANPVNVMGASKKLMEEVILSYSQDIPITTARFANVAFSNGSLLFGYLQRMMKRQAITCPSDVKRFFVSPEESGQICMLSCLLGQSGEILFPKLEESELTSFKDVTLRFFEEANIPLALCESEDEARALSFSRADSDPYPVYFFASDTSGEKMFEEFYTHDDDVDFDQFSSLGVIKNAPRQDREHVRRTLNTLREKMNQPHYSKADIVSALTSIIPGFEHIETGKNLDQKM